MSDNRKQSTQDKIDTVHATAKAMAPIDVPASDVGKAIVDQVKLVHGDPKDSTQST